MAERAEGAGRRVRVAALLLIAGLAAGPVGTHVYWVLGGTWGLHRSVGGRIEGSTTTGIRVVAAIVVVLLVAAVFLGETVASFTYSREYEWWLYGPVSLVLAVLALVVAGSGGAWPRLHRPHRTLPMH